MENFVITIARQYGSGGRTVGKMLAEKLGVSFYDKQIIQMASDESGIDVNLFGQVEEGSSVKVSLFNKTGLYKGDLIAPDQKGFVSDENIFNYQAKIATDLAEKESCVIVGKCADYVLKGRKNVVSIYIEAPRAFCLARTMQRMKVSADVAAATIENTDKYRADYYKYYTKGNYWTNPVNYDMTLNSEKVGIAGCVKMIEEYLVMKGLITREQILSEQITKGEEKK